MRESDANDEAECACGSWARTVGDEDTTSTARLRWTHGQRRWTRINRPRYTCTWRLDESGATLHERSMMHLVEDPMRAASRAVRVVAWPRGESSGIACAGNTPPRRPRLSRGAGVHHRRLRVAATGLQARIERARIHTQPDDRGLAARTRGLWTRARQLFDRAWVVTEVRESLDRWASRNPLDDWSLWQNRSGNPR